MSREIKFRAWSTTFNAMIIPERFDVIGFHNGEVEYVQSITAGYDKGTYELMQYTGLKDKNGVEIYEGDIVKYKGHNCSVVWQKDDCRFSLVKSSGFEIYKCDYTFWGKSEVIGNIHEHPHLLEGDAK